MKAEFGVTESQLEDWVKDVQDWAEGEEMITGNTFINWYIHFSSL